MGERELREKYGGKLDKAINRAVRAESPQGNAALDTLTKLSGPAFRSGWTDASGNPTPEAAAYLKHQKNVVDPLIAKVRKTWGLPPADPSEMPTGKRKKRSGGKLRPRSTGTAKKTSRRAAGGWRPGQS